MLDTKYLKKWLRATFIRCARTFAITFVGLMPATATLKDIQWITVISSCIFSSVVCFFTCVTGLPETNDEKEITQMSQFIPDEEIENLEEV